MKVSSAELPAAAESFCPGCGKGIDPLRAGHVAIIGAQFLYFCDQACKVAHLHAIADGAALADDVATAEPPPVSFPRSTRETSVVPVSGVTPKAIETLAEIPVALPAAEPEPQVEEKSADRPAEPDYVVTSPASTLPSVSPKPEPEPEPAPSVAPSEGGRPATRLESEAASTRNSALMGAITAGGAVAGVLAWALWLAGPGVAPMRLPLACLAMGALLLNAGLQKRDPADAHALVSLLPTTGALAVAVAARMTDDARALPFAAFAGLAAASALGVELLLARGRTWMRDARERIARGLDLPVRVVRGEETVTMSARLVRPGEQVVVMADEVAGVDGQVVAGEAQVVPWLDAPIEVTKREGDAVVAGARVVSGRLRLTVTWAADERAWTKLALSPHLRVDVAAPLARSARALVERGSVFGALLVGIAVYANNGAMLDVLAAACAAALACGAVGAAAAVALCHAKGHLAGLRHGIVYKDADGFDRAGRTDVAVVCSRGTVLMGEPEIVALEPLGSVEIGRLVALAAGAETASTHPFAAAILRAAHMRGERPETVRNATVHAGLGVTALAATGDRLVVGSRALLLQEKVSVAMADARVSALEAQGRSVLLVALAGKLVGLLALQDGLRPGARGAVQRLLDARIEPVLLSGEARETCDTIGRALDIDHVRPEVLPADRGAEVRALGEGGHVVAVLGHPAADDGALGAADVSVAMSSAGATPGEWTIALASDDVRDAALALSLAHTTRDRARLALAFGLVPPVLATLAIAFGLAPLAVAPLAAILGTAAALTHAKA